MTCCPTRWAAYSPHAVQKGILSGHGSFTTPLRGVRFTGNERHLAALSSGTYLDLVRDRSNPADPNAIRVEYYGHLLGWIAKGTARPLALALDNDPAPFVEAVLRTDTRAVAQSGNTQQFAVRTTGSNSPSRCGHTSRRTCHHPWSPAENEERRRWRPRPGAGCNRLYARATAAPRRDRAPSGDTLSVGTACTITTSAARDYPAVSPSQRGLAE